MQRLVRLLAFTLAASAHPTPDVGEPLKLTPYIEAGKLEEARNLALVKGLEPKVLSYSGLITVDKVCDSNIYFWFFPSENSPEDPVSVWLNGGPGSSSMFGLFTENGPYSLSMDGKISKREYAWNRNSSIMFVDNPVGVGYSYTKGGIPCYSANETHVGQNFVRFLEQFFMLFPNYLNNPFYLTGESYAGKYIPAIAHTILKTRTSFQLTGFAIGNGFIDPGNQAYFAEAFYQLGFIDKRLKNEVENDEETVRELTEKGKYTQASELWWDLLTNTVGKPTGYQNSYNFLLPNGDPVPDFPSFVQQPKVRQALHVGNIPWDNGTLCGLILRPEMMMSVKPWLEELMNNYRVLLYFGQTDLWIGYRGSMMFIEKLKWNGSGEYFRAQRKQYRVDGELAGYSKSGGNFTEILIRNAGHLVPVNQPKWAYDMYNRFIFNKPF